MQPPNFRVLLHNDTVNRSDYVVRVLVKVVDGLTEDTASGIMQVRQSGEEGEGKVWEDGLDDCSDDSMQQGEDFNPHHKTHEPIRGIRNSSAAVHLISHSSACPISQEAHTTGVALVTSCFQELAELYCQRLRGCGLRASLEPVRPNFSGAGASS